MTQRELTERIAILKQFAGLLKAAAAGTEEHVLVQRKPLHENAVLLEEIANELMELIPETEIKVEVEDDPLPLGL